MLLLALAASPSPVGQGSLCSKRSAGPSGVGRSPVTTKGAANGERRGRPWPHVVRRFQRVPRLGREGSAMVG